MKMGMRSNFKLQLIVIFRKTKLLILIKFRRFYMKLRKVLLLMMMILVSHINPDYDDPDGDDDDDDDDDDD